MARWLWTTASEVRAFISHELWAQNRHGEKKCPFLMNADLPNTHLGSEQAVQSNGFFSQMYINTTVFWGGEGIYSEKVQAGELFPSLPSVRKVSWKTKDFGRLWTLCKGGQVTDADREDQVGPENEMQVEDEVQATAVGWWSADRWEEQAEDGTPRKRKTEWESKDFKYWSSSGMNLKPWVSLLAFIQNNT